MELMNLLNTIPEREPILRVYDNYAVLNAAAVTLLGLEDGDYIRFMQSRFGRVNGKPFLYVRKSEAAFGSTPVRRRHRVMRVDGRPLARLLKDALDGTGVYRVCPDDTIRDDTDGQVCYNIFFRNYDKKNTD
jgi:hypothetical protein